MNTLLHYRFVRKSDGKSSDDDESTGGQQNSTDSSKTFNLNGSMCEGSTQEHSQQSLATTTIPESPMPSSSIPQSPSPVFRSKMSSFIRPISESEESFDTQKSENVPWLSKDQGKENHLTNGSSNFQKLKKFRRVRAISESDSDDGQSSSSAATCPVTPVAEPDDRSQIAMVNQLKGMFPIRATSQLAEAVDLFAGNVDAIVNCLMDGNFDTELVNRKRKRQEEENGTASDGGRAFKRIRTIPNSDTLDSASVTSDQSTCLSQSLRDERLSQMVEAFPDHDEKVLLKALEDCKWSTEDAMMSLATVSVNGASKSSSTLSSTKGKKKEKRKMRGEEDLSDEDEEYFEDGWDSDDSMEEEEAMGQALTILSFFEDATLEELTTVPGCSRKKAELIISLRPFSCWDDLVQKFESAKSISYSIISGCKETIHVRNIVTKLMKRCERIAEEMESVVTSLSDPNAGDCERITEKPTLLTDKFELTPYQMIGLNWLRIMHSQELNGLLADEMGLGKTIQTIAFLAHLMEHGDPGPHAIIVPSSTIDNWLREMKTWCPSMKVIIYYGSMEERRLARYRILMEGKRDFNVLLTTYTIATGSVEDRSLFKKCRFHYAVFDEGHMLKNMASLRFQNLMKLNAERRLLLTGTPLQNNLVELMSLLCFVMPELFIGKTEPLKKIFSMISRQAGEDNNQGRYEKSRIAQAKRIMKPFVLRRLKSEVLKDLPKKQEEICRCPMTTSQQVLYDSLIAQYSKQMESETPSGGGMSMFMQLRKASNHPLLVRNIYNDDKVKAMAKLIAKEPSHKDRGALPHLIQEDMAILNDFDINALCKQYPKYIGSYSLDISSIMESGKFKLLDSVLEKCQAEGDRVLLFSQFVMMLDILVPYLKEKNIRYIRLDGSTPVPERQKLIDQYNTDSGIFVFLLSTRAGGLGINLTAANTIILHDIDFNPYNDKQAEDRCHRLGQTRTVKVLKLVSKGTVEEGMLRCAQEKLKLEKDVTTSDKGDDNEEATDVVSLLKEAFVQYKKHSS